VERAPPERLLVDLPPLDRRAVDRPLPERLLVERFAVERFAVERFAVERFAVERFAVERFAVDPLAVERPVPFFAVERRDLELRAGRVPSCLRRLSTSFWISSRRSAVAFWTQPRTWSSWPRSSPALV
jgi:hypothetical protein